MSSRRPILAVALAAALGLVAMPGASAGGETLTGSRTDHRDGSASVSVGRSLPTAWNASIGADFELIAPPGGESRERPLPDPTAASSGAAWAKTTLPQDPVGLWDQTTLEARIDPTHDQGTLGTRFSRSVPVGDSVSVTFENGYAVMQPLRSGAAAGDTTGHWENDQALRLKLAPAGTTLSLSSRRSSADQQRLNAISAEKTLFGPLTVTGTVSETTTGVADRSITAGFKTTW